MVIGINDLDDDDEIFELPVATQTEPPTEPSTTEEPEEDILSDYLKTRGIQDLLKINFLDDNDLVITRSWNDLSKEEKLNILSTPIDTPNNSSNNDLTNEEIEFLNMLRQNSLTPQQYLQQISQPQEPVYKVDDLSDDELYLLDLEARVGELTDELAANALNYAKSNEDLYKRQVEGIRKEYKEKEDFNEQLKQAELQELQQQAFREYQQAIINAIDGFNSVGNLDLTFEDADKEDLAEFMLSQDETGKNYLYQALQDPQTLVKAAWFILNGDDAFNNVSDYFKNLIKLVSDNQYKKGYLDGLKGAAPTRPTVYVDKTKTNPRIQYNTIDQLDDDED